MRSRSQNWMAGSIRILMKERQLQIPRSVVSLPIAATVAKRQVSFAETTVIHVPFENEGRKPSHFRKHCMTELPAMEQIQEQIVESIKEGPQERVQQRTVEQNVRASPYCAGTKVRIGNSKSSCCQADPKKRCGDHSTRPS